MRIAGYTYSFATLLDKRQIDTPRIIHFYRELGVEGVEITAGYIREGEFPAVKKALADTGLTAACFDVVCDASNPDRVVRQERVKGLHADLKRAAELGARTVLVVPGVPRDDVPHATSRQWFAEALRDSLAESKRLGVTMTVANVGWQPVVYGTPEQLLGICEQVGSELKMTYDVGNFLLAGVDNLKALEREFPRIVHVHYKDWKVVPAGTKGVYPGVDGTPYLGEVLGDGVLNLPEALAVLRKLGYKGWVSVEYEGTGDPVDAARRGVAYLRSLMEGVPVGAGR